MVFHNVTELEPHTESVQLKFVFFKTGLQFRGVDLETRSIFVCIWLHYRNMGAFSPLLHMYRDRSVFVNVHCLFKKKKSFIIYFNMLLYNFDALCLSQCLPQKHINVGDWHMNIIENTYKSI